MLNFVVEMSGMTLTRGRIIFVDNKFFDKGRWYSWCVRQTENLKEVVRFLPDPRLKGH